VLELKDLKSHRERLIKIFEHVKRELDAIDLLIRGFDIWGADDAAKPVNHKRQGLPTKIMQIIEERPENWFKASEITDELITRGIRKERQRKNMRPSISNYLRQLADNGRLVRQNVGSEASPLYEYKISEQRAGEVDK